MAVQRRILVRRLISALATVIAAASLFIIAGSIAVWSSMLWSVIAIIAMRDGRKSAPKENWSRTNGWLGTLTIYGILVPLICAPPIVFGFLHGLIPAVSSAWLILVTMGVSDRFLTVWFGPIANPYADEQMDAIESRT